jgi:hypothetical protein
MSSVVLLECDVVEFSDEDSDELLYDSEFVKALSSL